MVALENTAMPPKNDRVSPKIEGMLRVCVRECVCESVCV